jgi:hypothetical protein
MRQGIGRARARVNVVGFPRFPSFLVILIELIELLHKAQIQAGPSAPVLLCFEPGAMENGYDEKATEGISDVRLVDDWPLPGKSLVTHEGDKPQKLVLFYDNHHNLDSSTEA